MSSAPERLRRSQTKWLDAAALSASRRCAGLTSILFLGGIMLPLLTWPQPQTQLPAVQPLVLTLRSRLSAPEPKLRPPLEKRRLTAAKSSFTAVKPAEKKPEPPAASKPEPPTPPRAKAKPQNPESEKPKTARQAPSQAQPQVGAAEAKQGVRAEASASSKQTALRFLLTELERRKRYPKQARRTGAQGLVTLKVSIGFDGKVKGCAVVKNCGLRVLDAEAARLGSKLLGLDTGLRGEAFSVQIPVRYTLQ